MIDDNKELLASVSPLVEDETEAKDVASAVCNDNVIVEQTKLVRPMDANVQISCEIGSVAITLEKLMQLKVNDTIEFIKWPNKVKLKLNGLMFAEGYLVDVNGMLGVKISNRIHN